jgi:hypothetical protein
MAGEAGHLPVGSVIDAQPDDDPDESWTLRDIPWCHCEEESRAQVAAAGRDNVNSNQAKRNHAERAAGHVQAFAAPDSIVERAVNMGIVGREGTDLIAKLSARPRADHAVSRLFHQGGVALGRAVVSAINWVNPARILIYLPPALAEENEYLAGNCYRKGLEAEVAESAFTLDYVSENRLLVNATPEAEMRKHLVSAAAYLVFAHLLETLAPRTPRRVAEYKQTG